MAVQLSYIVDIYILMSRLLSLYNLGVERKTRERSGMEREEEKEKEGAKAAIYLDALEAERATKTFPCF